MFMHAYKHIGFFHFIDYFLLISLDDSKTDASYGFTSFEHSIKKIISISFRFLHFFLFSWLHIYVEAFNPANLLGRRRTSFESRSRENQGRFIISLVVVYIDQNWFLNFIVLLLLFNSVYIGFLIWNMKPPSFSIFPVFNLIDVCSV